jgi:hypothetical protein
LKVLKVESYEDDKECEHGLSRWKMKIRKGFMSVDPTEDLGTDLYSSFVSSASKTPPKCMDETLL